MTRRNSAPENRDAPAIGRPMAGLCAFRIPSILLLSVTAAMGGSCGYSGQHDATASHSFSNVDHWVKVFDDPSRDEWQKPGEVVSAIGLEPGQVVADLGAGTGYFMPWLSRAVGDEGRVLSLDVEPGLVAHLGERAAKEGLTNAEARVCPYDSPGLPDGSVDLVLIVDTWHHIDDRLSYLPRLARALRPAGRVAVVDYEKDIEPPSGPKREHRMARELVVSEFEEAGWELVAEPDVLEYQYILIFEPPAS